MVSRLQYDSDIVGGSSFHNNTLGALGGNKHLPNSIGSNKVISRDKSLEVITHSKIMLYNKITE